MAIRNIIFDLGGVILNIDYNKTVEAFKALGVTNFDEIYSRLKQTPLFDNFEKGAISAHDFIKEMKRYSELPISDEQVINAWNAMLLDLPKKNLVFLKELSKVYRLFLFSNTNAIHLPAFRRIIRQQHGIEDFSTFFEQDYYSHEMKNRKPEKEAFDHILHKHKLAASETLFIDDSPQHVEGARHAGLHAYLKSHGETLEAAVRNALLQV